MDLAFVIGFIGLSVFASAAPNLAAVGRNQSAYVRLVRAVATDRFGVPHPSGLAFAPGANAFLLADPLNMAFDSAAARLVIFDAAAVQLLDVQELHGRGLAPAAITRSTAQRFGVQRPQGLAFDPTSGRLFVLDGAGPEVARVDPALVAGAVAGLRDRRVAQVDLRAL